MKTIGCMLKFILPFILMIGAGCEQNNKELSQLEDKLLTILEVNAEGCKQSLKSSETDQYFELKAEGENKLRLKFCNATINCAGLDSTYAVIINGVLKVFFLEDHSENCFCDFDLECLIDSMENRSYDLEVYAHSEEPKAKFTFIYSSILDSKIEISR